MIRIDCEPNTAGDLDREWLETDGRGGYASSTLADCHTRRYHGLLVANLSAPEGRHVLLSKLEDAFRSGDEELFFSRHRYPGVFLPPGPSPLWEFQLDLFPRFTYRAGAREMQKSVLLLRDGATVLIRYHLRRSPAKGLLRLKPFLAFRGYHRLSGRNDHLRSQTEAIAQGFRIDPYGGMPSLFVTASLPCRFVPEPLWYNDFEYSEERKRGFDWHEDLFLPGGLEVPLAPGETVIFSASCAPPGEPPEARWEAEIARRQEERAGTERLIAPLFSGPVSATPGKGAAGSPATPSFSGQPADGGERQGGKDAPPDRTDGSAEDREILLTLIEAGRRFLVTTPSGRPAIIAGYHWFGSWGRDSLISLPGLAFCCGKREWGIEILTELGRHEREGLLPNFFSEDGRPEAYNTVDSALLYFWTVQELLQTGNDALPLIRDRFWPVMKRIIASFREGTRYGIGMDARGLLRAGDGQKALTWMDATVNEKPVTPRHGCAVEINALWYNALCLARELAARFADPEAPAEDLIARTRRSFQETFWIPEEGYLGDVYRDGILDRALRPNQLLAVSLPFSPLTAAQQAGVVRTVRERLLTPCGPRTLAPNDPAYRGRYRGTGAERDAAYHQGTVWPWLWGPFGEAALRVAKDKKKEQTTLRHQLRSFLSTHLREAGIGSVSEVFDGDLPQRPGGCIAQAWSVAELIRLYRLLLS
ncbi:MAG: glycogen debranching enzyme N-terminal domain-containing protein [Deltaproteobacteria bacterium]|nr:glycogen debranching enzyme N-terminal domain-containing protein [Deltaproteobacteria bacterium]